MAARNGGRGRRRARPECAAPMLALVAAAVLALALPAGGEMSVTSVQPRALPLRGGTTVTVHGTGFVDAPTLSCRFGLSDVPAYFDSTGTLHCISPQGPAGFAAVQIALGGDGDGDGDITRSSDTTVLFRAPPLVTAVSPAVGVAHVPTSVHVFGGNLVAGTACGVRTRAGTAELPGARVSSALTRCEVGPLAIGLHTLGAGLASADESVPLVLDSELPFPVMRAGEGATRVKPLVTDEGGGVVVEVDTGAVSCASAWPDAARPIA
eukprot:PRCOL_00000502-RA